MASATSWPLNWPAGFPRTLPEKRERGSFKTTLSGALKNVQDSLRRFAVDSGKPHSHLVISSNYSLGDEHPKDPGVVLYFMWDGLAVAILVDRYTKIEANLQALHHVLEARRVELRHGTLALVRASFAGFKALPAPSGRSWREVLGFTNGGTPRIADVEAAFREAARAAHPDRGGSHDLMSELNLALSEARLALGGTTFD